MLLSPQILLSLPKDNVSETHLYLKDVYPSSWTENRRVQNTDQCMDQWSDTAQRSFMFICVRYTKCRQKKVSLVEWWQMMSLESILVGQGLNMLLLAAGANENWLLIPSDPSWGCDICCHVYCPLPPIRKMHLQTRPVYESHWTITCEWSQWNECRPGQFCTVWLLQTNTPILLE